MSRSITLPYATPVERPSYGKAFLRILLVMIACGTVFAILGGLVGLLVGTHAGDYYRTVFRNDGIDAPKVGLVLGAAQGGALGVVAGLGMAMILTWREVRLARGTPAT